MDGIGRYRDSSGHEDWPAFFFFLLLLRFFLEGEEATVRGGPSRFKRGALWGTALLVDFAPVGGVDEDVGEASILSTSIASSSIEIVLSNANKHIRHGACLQILSLDSSLCPHYSEPFSLASWTKK